jgi:hypothetical protein
MEQYRWVVGLDGWSGTVLMGGCGPVLGGGGLERYSVNGRMRWIFWLSLSSPLVSKTPHPPRPIPPRPGRPASSRGSSSRSSRLATRPSGSKVGISRRRRLALLELLNPPPPHLTVPPPPHLTPTPTPRHHRQGGRRRDRHGGGRAVVRRRQHLPRDRPARGGVSNWVWVVPLRACLVLCVCQGGETRVESGNSAVQEADCPCCDRIH